MCLLRLLVQVENKVKARKQAEKILQKKANKIKQKIENKEKTPSEKKESKKSRGALQREKKRARKEAGKDENVTENAPELNPKTKTSKVEDAQALNAKEKGPKLAKPQKKRKTDAEENQLEDMIRSYKETFGGGKAATPAGESTKPKIKSREAVAKRRWFE
jgi:hypothetical protein